MYKETLKGAVEMKLSKNFAMEFCTVRSDIQFSAECAGRKAFECLREGGKIIFRIWYDFSENPLELSAEAEDGDKIAVKVFDFRIELYVNSELCDEEWCCGRNYTEQSELAVKNTEITFSEAVPEKKESPSVLYTFENAEGWRPGGGVYVGDCMPYCDGGRYHVIYLKDRRHHRSKWGYGAHQWEHISTADFVTWQVHPTMVEITESWEGSICTGSHIKDGETHYLYYTVRTCDGSPAPIMRSVSQDGCHYEKDRSFGFKLSGKYHASSARDPKLVKDSEGIYHMFVTTSLSENGRGCLAHLTSGDMQSWKEEEKPIYVSDTADQPECPDYFEKDGYYYLVFSLRGQGQYLYSKLPFEGWKKPENPIIPCSSVPKAAVFGGKIIFTGFKAECGYAGTMTFRTADTGENGELEF